MPSGSSGKASATPSWTGCSASTPAANGTYFGTVPPSSASAATSPTMAAADAQPAPEPARPSAWPQQPTPARSVGARRPPAGPAGPPRREPAHAPARYRRPAARARLMAPVERRDRRVIRHLRRRDQLVGDVLPARPLDPPRGPIPARVRVQQQRHPIIAGHTPPDPARSPDTPHRTRPNPSRRPPLAPSTPNGLRNPIHQRRRQPQHLPAITHNEVLSHPGIVLNRPHRTPRADSLERGCRAH